MVLKIEPNAGGGQRGRRGLTQSQYQEIEEGKRPPTPEQAMLCLRLEGRKSISAYSHIYILTLEYACLSVCVSVTKRPHLTHYPQANTLSTAAPKLDSG